MSIKEFFKFLASDREAVKLMNEVFDENLCRSETCKRCVEARVDYWYKKWLFGVVKDPVQVALDIHGCLRIDEEACAGEPVPARFS